MKPQKLGSVKHNNPDTGLRANFEEATLWTKFAYCQVLMSYLVHTYRYRYALCLFSAWIQSFIVTKPKFLLSLLFSLVMTVLSDGFSCCWVCCCISMAPTTWRHHAPVWEALPQRSAFSLPSLATLWVYFDRDVLLLMYERAMTCHSRTSNLYFAVKHFVCK